MESFENRDLQCANEVSEMARLGKFNIEWQGLLLCNRK